MIKPITKTIDALKASPVTLSMVLMNVGLLALLAYTIMVAADHRRQIYKAQKEIIDILAKCRVDYSL